VSKARIPETGEQQWPGADRTPDLNGGGEPVRHALPGAHTTPEAVAAVHEVPPEPPPIRGHDPIRGIDNLVVPIIFALLYGVIGYFVLTNGRIVSFDALARLNEAYMVWWNSPPKLAAILLNAPPLGAIAYLPLTLVKPLATSLVAMPVLTAIAGGITVGAVNSILKRCETPVILRVVLLVLFGLNPMFVYYAGNGEPVMLGLAAAALALLSLISWEVTGETRHVVGAGLMIAIAAMFDYGYALWALGFMIAILVVSAGRRESTDRTRSTLLVFLAPVTYAFAVWILLNAVLTGEPFGWLSTQPGPIQVNTTGVLQGVTATLGGSLSDLFQVVLGVAPLGFLAAVLLVAGAVSGSRLSFGLLVVLVAALAVPVLRALIADQADLVDLSAGLPLAVLATAAVAWIHHGGSGWRGIAAVALALGLVAALPLGWDAMKNYRFQNQAQAFTRYVDTRDSQEGTRSVGGYTVGVDPELVMARYINNVLPQESDRILVDENFSYGVMITSGRPNLFFDRADQGENTWRSVVDSPYGKVSYMLIATGRGGDQLRKAWPAAIEGGEAGLTPVFRTGRYVLIQVSGTRPETPRTGSTGPGPQSVPRPVTPSRPLSPDQSATPPPVQTEPGVSPASPPPAAGTAPVSPPPSPGGSSAPSVVGE